MASSGDSESSPQSIALRHGKYAEVQLYPSPLSSHPGQFIPQSLVPGGGLAGTGCLCSGDQASWVGYPARCLESSYILRIILLSGVDRQIAPGLWPFCPISFIPYSNRGQMNSSTE